MQWGEGRSHGRRDQKEGLSEGCVSYFSIQVTASTAIYVQMKTRSRALSLPRQAFMQNLASDSSSEQSPKTPGQATATFVQAQRTIPGMSNPRDSFLSTTSSSLYPASTATGTFTESSFPYSIDDDLEQRLTPVAPEIASADRQEFDADDVSYRLRLLVNNSYFLPPAHAKPSPLSLNHHTAGGQKVSPKSSAGTFLDFFRLGKSKSKPTTPFATSPPTTEQQGPILRTTSDSTTTSGFITRQYAGLSPQAPNHVVPALSNSRVVVVRERMDDLAAAAKEAEQDLRIRAVRKTRSQSFSRPQPSHLDIIDPTDAVDLPPSSGYPFAVQASAVYGVNVSGALDAAVLAEQLAPYSPGAWSSNTEDDAWRKALLAQAVHHSLSNSMDTSFASTPTDHSRLTSSAGPSGSGSSSGHMSRPSDAFTQSTNFRSLTDPSKSSSGHASQPSEAFSLGTHVLSLSGPSRGGSSGHGHTSQPSESFSQAAHSTPNPKIGQRILEDLHVATEDNYPPSPTTPTQAKAPSSAHSHTTFSSASDLALAVQRSPRQHAGSPPVRSESPTRTAALPPPPRRPILNPLFSHSQPDLTDPDIESGPLRPPMQSLRKVMSSPGLSESREAVLAGDIRATSPMSISQRLSMGVSPVMLNVEAIPSRSSYRSFMSQLTSDSRVSDDLSYVTPDDTDVDQMAQQRPSVTVSRVSEGRPSITASEYSVPSPTASAFHDAIFGSYRSPSALSRRSFLPEVSGASRSVSPVSPAVSVGADKPEGHRGQTLSPPPRSSVSSVHTALAPPPRSSPRASPRPPPSPLRDSTEVKTQPTSTSGRPFSIQSIGSDSLQTTSPDSPEFPASPRSLAGRRGHASPLALRIPEELAPPTIHSAPAPSSPADFFDKIESTMDEMESTDGSDQEDEEAALTPPRPPFAHSRSDSQQTTRTASAGSPRSSIMRLGNHSTPSLRWMQRQEEAAELGDTQFSDAERMKPISNVPTRPRRRSFFTSRKKGLKNTDIPLLPFRDIATSHGVGSSELTPDYTPRRPATSGGETKAKLPKRESMLQFEGMLHEYAQAERERIKRIATGMSGNPR